MLQSLVVSVFWDGASAESCFASTHFCAKSDSNPLGIPVWKIFSFHFWHSAANPLGREWTFSPEDYGKVGQPNTYLGYTIEFACLNTSFVDTSDRREQAYILGKWLHYFIPGRSRWPPHFFEAAINATGVQFVGGTFDSELDLDVGKPELPSNFVNYGLQPRTEFLKILSSSKMLIGLGDPGM
jgi:hypothetical protein